MSATHEKQSLIREIAEKHGFREEAASAMASALTAGHGTMAQFNHPDLGGMGQWSRGGMLMIGDMFNDGLKARVGALANDLAAAVTEGRLASDGHGEGAQHSRNASSSHWWPEELGSPSSSGGQNDSLYAVFPQKRRLAIKRDGRVTIYDTADYMITGVSQQHGSHSSLTFGTAEGTISIDTLKQVGDDR